MLKWSSGIKVCNKTDYASEIILVIVCMVSFIRILTYRVLYADGGWYTMNIVRFHRMFFVTNRTFLQWVQQILASNSITFASLHNTHYFVVLLGIGYFGLPIVLLFSTYLLLKSDRIMQFSHVVAMSFAILFFGGMVGESCLTACFVIFFSALLTQRITTLRFVILLTVAIILIASYESMVFYGLILLYLLNFKVKNYASQLGQNLFRVVLSFLLISAILFQVYWILFPSNPANRSGAFDIRSLLAFQSTKIYLFTLAIGLVLGLLIHKNVAWVIAIPLACGLIALDLPFFQVSPKFQYSFRLFGSLMVLLLLLLSRDTFSFGKILNFDSTRKIVITVALLVAVLDVSASLGFERYIGKIQQLTSHPGTQPFDAIGASTNENVRFSWAWSMPSLSYVLAQTKDASLVSNQFPVSWQPFSPQKSPEHTDVFWVN